MQPQSLSFQHSELNFGLYHNQLRLIAFIPGHCVQTFLDHGRHAQNLKLKNSPAPFYM